MVAIVIHTNKKQRGEIFNRENKECGAEVREITFYMYLIGCRVKLFQFYKNGQLRLTAKN